METKRLFPGFRGRARGNKPQHTKELTKADFLAAFSCFWRLSVWRNSGVYVEFWRSAPVPLGAAYPTDDEQTGPTENRKHARGIWLGQSIEVIKLYLLVAFPT